MERVGRGAVAAAIVIALSALPALQAAELPIIKNSPIPDFQNRPQDVVPYDFDAPPQGLFRTITTAEGFDEELGVHRTHEIVPVKPTDRFRPDTQAVFIVFNLHQRRGAVVGHHLLDHLERPGCRHDGGLDRCLAELAEQPRCHLEREDGRPDERAPRVQEPVDEGVRRGVFV